MTRRILSTFEKLLEEKGLSRRRGFLLPDEDYRKMDDTLFGTSEQREESKRLLERHIVHFQLSYKEWRNAATNKQAKKNLRAVAGAAVRLSRASVNSRATCKISFLNALKRDEVLSRLRGLLIMLEGARSDASGYDDASLLRRFSKKPLLAQKLAHCCLQWGAGSRNRTLPGLTTYCPPHWLFTSVLLRFWSFHLGREITNWENESSTGQTAAPLTRFLNECLSLADRRESLAATKKRIAEVIRAMDRVDKTRSRSSWSIL